MELAWQKCVQSFVIIKFLIVNFPFFVELVYYSCRLQIKEMQRDIKKKTKKKQDQQNNHVFVILQGILFAFYLFLSPMGSGFISKLSFLLLIFLAPDMLFPSPSK